MIDFSKEIKKKKNDNDDEEPQLEKDYTHDMKKKIEKEELLRKLYEAESNICSSHEKLLEMEKE
jgi:hypothetical protein